MKKKILIAVSAMAMLCTACGSQQAAVPEMPQSPTELHVCEAVCLECGLCGNEACTEQICTEKCTGVHWEEPLSFSDGDYITDTAVSVDTGTLVFDIDTNVYVPAHLEEMAEMVAAAMEKVSGLDFDGQGNYARGDFQDEKVHVNVSRDSLYAGNPDHADWYQGLQTSEVGSAYAFAWSHAAVSPGDLFLGNSYAVIHELSHVLMFRQSEWSHCQLLNEGFAEYTTYLALRELEHNAPEAAPYLDASEHITYNMEIYDYEKLYEQPLEYWFENTFEYSGNSNYTVGFRFMAYLQDVYGDYSKWIPAFEDTYCFAKRGKSDDVSPVQQQIEILKNTYGETVLDDFYPWLRKHLDQFEANGYSEPVDRTGADRVNWYPFYSSVETSAVMGAMEYEDLYIHLEPLRRYISEYKQDDASELQLVMSAPVKVRLYQEDGTYTTVMGDQPIPLEGISYIKLVGKDKLDWLKVVGAFCVSRQ